MATVTRKNLETFAKNDIGFHGLDISRISSIFIAQVIQMQLSQAINTHQMLDEIKYLEGIKNISSTKKADFFRGYPLKGLKKKHFTDASFIIENLGAHFSYKYDGNTKLDYLIKEAFAKNKSGYFDDDFIGYIAHQATIGAIEKRATKKKITGEWIVFQEHQGEKYYLTLASHKENNKDIFKRVKDAYDLDFNFLRNLI